MLSRYLSKLPRRLTQQRHFSSFVRQEDVTNFQRDGAIVLRGVFSDDVVASLQSAADDNMSKPGPLCDEHSDAAGTSGRFHDDQFMWTRHEANYKFVTDGHAADVAAAMMESQTAHIFYDHLLVKEPGTVSPTPWHNDMSYWHIQGSQIISLWVALDHVPKDAGVCYVAGSHKWQLQHKITSFSGSDGDDGRYGSFVALELPDIDEQVSAQNLKLLSWDLAPGDVLVHHGWSVHGAPGNPRGARRRGLASRWCGDDITLYDKPGTMRTKWQENGYIDGLSHGDPIASALHPNTTSKSSYSGRYLRCDSTP